MPFKVVRRKKEIVLNHVIEGSNKFGDGLSCHQDWVTDPTTVLNFLEFIRNRKGPDDDETKILLGLFPEEAKQIKSVLDAQAKAALQGQPGPLRTGETTSRPAFDDDEEE